MLDKERPVKDKKDIRGRADLNNDGITGYTQGANQRSNWICAWTLTISDAPLSGAPSVRAQRSSSLDRSY